MEEELTISLTQVLEKVRKQIVAIILIAVVGAMIAGGYTIKATNYQCSGKLVISKESAKIFYEDSYTQSDILMYQKIINTYIEIAKSNAVRKAVANQVKGYTPEAIAGMTTISSIDDTLIIKLDIKGKNANDVYHITNEYMNAIINQCNTILPVGNLELLDEAEYPVQPVTRNLYASAFVGGLIGLVASGIIIFLQILLDSTRITTSQQAQQLLGVEVKATIV